MTNRERYELIEKRENGTLTDAEFQQYLTLLQTDPAFYEAVVLHQSIHDSNQEASAKQQWDLAGEVLAEAGRSEQSISVWVWVRKHPGWVASSLVAVLVGVLWAIWPPAGPQLLKVANQDVFLADTTKTGGVGYAEGSYPIATVLVQWIEDRKQLHQIDYLYCRDTLSFFVKRQQDTTQLKTVRLVYRTSNKALYFKRLQSPLLPIQSCQRTAFLP